MGRARDIKTAIRHDSRYNDLYRCALKKRYPSEKSARMAATHYNQRYYECDNCKEWHLTIQKRGKSPQEKI